MLGREKRDYLNAGGEHAVNISLAVAVETGVIGDQSDLLSF